MSQPSASSSIAQRRTSSGSRPSSTAASSTPGPLRPLGDLADGDARRRAAGAARGSPAAAGPSPGQAWSRSSPGTSAHGGSALQLEAASMRDDHDVSGHDGLAPAERLLSRAADGATARGRPLSRRARQTQRSVEAYLKAGVRPRWMERVDEIDQGMRAEKQRLARAYRALGEECGEDPAAFARALARARARRGASTTSTCSSSSTTTGIRSSASCRWTHAPATTCASPGAPIAARSSARTGSSSTSRPSSTFPARARAGTPRARGRLWTPSLLANIGGGWRRAAMPRSSSACATSFRSRGSPRPSPRPLPCRGWATPPRPRWTTSPPRAAARRRRRRWPRARSASRWPPTPPSSSAIHAASRRTPSAASSTPRSPSATAATRRSSPSRRPSR